MPAKKRGGRWVDFRQVKEQVRFEQVLEYYGLLDGLRRKGEELVGYCPLHDERRYNKDAFSVNTARNIFHCFACGASGNVLDFVCQRENLEPREAALALQDRFLSDQPEAANEKRPRQRAKEREASQTPEAPTDPVPASGEATVNPPLTFELKNLDSKHPYLNDRGLDQKTIATFGLGYCNRGLMQGRIVIPLHNERGELVGYAGRWPGEPPEGEPKYKFPPKFHKSAVLFNLHRVDASEAEDKGLILVEGFFGVFHLWKAQFYNVVALMGTALTPEQEGLLLAAVGERGKVVLLLDKDEPGQEATARIVEQLVGKVYVRVVDLGEASEPEELSVKQAQELLCFAR